jgi:Rieske 2Fe-2S family protein
VTTVARPEPQTDRPSPDLRALVATRRTGFTLEQPFYTSPDIHRADLDLVWGRSWILATTEAELPEPGDFVTVDVGDRSVVVIRDDEEVVRAFHNVCRHRGALLLAEERGSVGNLVCGYHRWTYATDGRLLHAPQVPSGFDRGCFSLRPVATRTMGGLVLVCLADEPPADVDDVVARVAPYLAAHDLASTKVAAREDLVEQGNWKLVMENNRECYHCDGHPELSCSFFPTYGLEPDEVPPRLLPAWERQVVAEADLTTTCERLGLPRACLEEISGRPTGFRVAREALDGAGESFSRDGSAVCRRLLGSFDTPRLGRLSVHLQPNAWLHVMADHAVVFRVLPRDVGTSVVTTTWLVHRDAVEGVDYDVDELTEVWRETNLQDAELVRRTQAGVRSPAYTPGPYNPSEYQVDAFCAWYVERMSEGLGA